MNLILQAIKSLIRKVENGVSKTVTALEKQIAMLSSNLSAVKKSASNAQTIAENAQITADGKMSAINPVGNGSFSMNRKKNTKIGASSHAEGYETTASGNCSHAEGQLTQATEDTSATVLTTTNSQAGNSSHAEGYGTVACGRVSHAEGHGTKAGGKDSHAEGYKTITGEGTSITGNLTESGQAAHAEGYGTVASGAASHAEGHGSDAVGHNSHAEGFNTTASAYASHAEGQVSNASGQAAHAEGHFTVASGGSSHAEGYEATASGSASHAEGYKTTASGNYAHAEGDRTTASGNNSHAEGTGTIASRVAHNVIGQYNRKDDACRYINTYEPANGVSSSKAKNYCGDYVHIVGNGVSDTERSNAHTLDWEGNAWYQGDVYVGSTSGTNRDDGSKKLATEEYVDNSIKNGAGGGLADWDANEGEVGYILNRTHYKEPAFVNIVDSTINYDSYEEGFYVYGFTPAIGERYRVSIDGDTEQEFTLAEDMVYVYEHSSNGRTYTLNFSTGWYSIYIAISDGSTDSFSLSVDTIQDVYHTIPEEYLPKLVGHIYEGSEGGEVFNSELNEAPGENSHAEGTSTKATGYSSHAEGQFTNAVGASSHAEGNGTAAITKSQHVQGEYNVLDTSDSATTRGKYAHIVGNGNSRDKRSNAHTLDWDGVPWYQGRPQFGGNAQDDGAQTVVANGDTEFILKSSTADSTKKFKITVDDSGTLTATEVI